MIWLKKPGDGGGMWVRMPGGGVGGMCNMKLWAMDGDVLVVVIEIVTDVELDVEDEGGGKLRFGVVNGMWIIFAGRVGGGNEVGVLVMDDGGGGLLICMIFFFKFAIFYFSLFFETNK